MQYFGIVVLVQCIVTALHSTDRQSHLQTRINYVSVLIQVSNHKAIAWRERKKLKHYLLNNLIKCPYVIIKSVSYWLIQQCSYIFLPKSMSGTKNHNSVLQKNKHQMYLQAIIVIKCIRLFRYFLQLIYTIPFFFKFYNKLFFKIIINYTSVY